ncbi:MAG: TfoX/Sxy family protein [Saprospiraceae bacterium]|nr:TfoX/Sxy family protein [Saprospiraceae bacterium]MCF8252539.1 TfoX/Sxy family protein [Saprospiraceae bacterium]MCF8282580.1 TfoX/Sxy family protein [Bacteroidales bacterium]MCF8310786.1 TfoX/Sxy family protein [Saprospiraceae bacterium]MCF8439384.1 TfoX/Sxy family protein [Saprospiraceae bacterium]
MENLITGERIADILTVKNIAFEQKKMFGGLCFMLDDKMLIGTYKGGIMARIDPAETETLVNRPGASQMIHGGRLMPGYLMLEPMGYEHDAELSFWVEKCLEYNPKVKASKKKK